MHRSYFTRKEITDELGIDPKTLRKPIMNSMHLTRLLFLVIVYSLFSCQHTKVPVTLLKADWTIDQLNDSSYISDIRSMYFDDNIFCADYDRDQIFIIDTTSRLLQIIGTKGRGPGELNGASQIITQNDTLWVYNDAKRCFEIFGSHGHLNSIRLPEIANYPGNFKFFVKGDRIYLTSVIEGHTIISFNVRTLSLEKYGDLRIFDTKKHTEIRNQKHLFGTDTYFLAVSDNLPVIEKYDYNGTKLEVFDYSVIPIVTNRLKVIRNENPGPNSYCLLLHDAYFAQSKLYLLLYTNKNNKISCQDVLVIDVSDKGMSSRQIFTLGESWYQSICATEGYLFAFGKNGFERFSIN